MLGWLFPRAPLDPVEKAWTETRMLWLAEQWGLPRLLEAQVVPAQQIVSDDYDGTVDNARGILARMCAPLKLTPEQFHLDVVTAECRTDSAPETAPNVIRVGDGQLRNPYAVAATLARELAWRQLPLENLTGINAGQLSWMADLAAVYIGWGGVVANGLADDQVQGHSCGCGPGQPGSGLPSRMLGYALALFAHVRGEVRPTWKSSLRPDALVVCDRSLTYLRRTEDTLFARDSVDRQPSKRATAELLQQLKTGSRSARVAALWELRDPSHADAATEQVVKCLHDRLPTIREEATRTIASYGATAKCALPALIDLLHENHYSLRAAAAHALGTIGTDSEEALADLAPLLRDPERQVVYEAAVAIKNFGERGGEAMPLLMAALRGAVIRCDHALIDTVTHTLFALDPDPTDRVMEFFEDDPELREQVVHILVDALGDPDADTAENDS